MTSSQHLFIESDANPRLKRWRRLALEAKAVRREGATVLEGIHLLQTVLEHPEVKINAVMLPEGRTTAEAKALAERAAQTAGTRLYVLNDRLYDAISPVENGVGVMCEIALPAAPAPEKWAAADALYLDGVQDAGGGVGRTGNGIHIGALPLQNGGDDPLCLGEIFFLILGAQNRDIGDLILCHRDLHCNFALKAYGFGGVDAVKVGGGCCKFLHHQRCGRLWLRRYGKYAFKWLSSRRKYWSFRAYWCYVK